MWMDETTLGHLLRGDTAVAWAPRPSEQREREPGSNVVRRVATTLLAIAALAVEAPAQAIHVVAKDSARDRPLESAMVVLLDQEADVIAIHRTDKRGRTAFPQLAAGHYALRVSASGFTDRVSGWIPLSGADTLEATIRLARGAQLLDLVVVTASTDSAARYLPIGVPAGTGATVMPPGLIERKAAGSGDYVSLIGSLGVKALTVRYWRRNEYSHDTYSCIRSTRGPAQGCVLTFINDVRVSDYEAAKSLIIPEQIGWAVYVPPSEAGVLYGDMSNNGVLLIYTKDRLGRLKP